MISGNPPFVTSTKAELFEKVLKEEPTFPQAWSPELKDFLTRLLEKCPDNRLGANNGFLDLVRHPWLATVNVADIRNKNIKPPIIIDPHSHYFSAKVPDSDVAQDLSVCREIRLSDMNLLDNTEIFPTKTPEYVDKIKELPILKIETGEKLSMDGGTPMRVESNKKMSFLQVPSQMDSTLGSRNRVSTKSRGASPESSMSFSSASDRASPFNSTGGNSSRSSAGEMEYETGMNEIRNFDKAPSKKMDCYKIVSNVKLYEINFRSPFYKPSE